MERGCNESELELSPHVSFRPPYFSDMNMYSFWTILFISIVSYNTLLILLSRPIGKNKTVAMMIPQRDVRVFGGCAFLIDKARVL